MNIKKEKINLILNALENQNKKENEKLAKKNLHSKQRKFKRGETFLKLAFLNDEDLDTIYNLVK